MVLQRDEIPSVSAGGALPTNRNVNSGRIKQDDVGVEQHRLHAVSAHADEPGIPSCQPDLLHPFAPKSEISPDSFAAIDEASTSCELNVVKWYAHKFAIRYCN